LDFGFWILDFELRDFGSKLLTPDPSSLTPEHLKKIYRSAKNCELCNKPSQIVGYNMSSGNVELFFRFRSIANIELNKFIVWNQVSRLASLKPNPPLNDGEHSGGQRSRFLHWSYLSWRSSTTHLPAASKPCRFYHKMGLSNHPNDVNFRFPYI
jgi:hypothetical protein